MPLAREIGATCRASLPCTPTCPHGQLQLLLSRPQIPLCQLAAGPVEGQLKGAPACQLHGCQQGWHLGCTPICNEGGYQIGGNLLRRHLQHGMPDSMWERQWRH